jgi:hypothetical protein
LLEIKIRIISTLILEINPLRSKSLHLFIDGIVSLSLGKKSYFRIVSLPCGATTPASEATPLGFRAT